MESPETHPSPGTPGPLAEGYYAENFALVLATVLERYEDLLQPAEQAFAQTVLDGLSLSARRLYVRLVSRKGPIFRRDLLAYPEIPDLDAAALELERTGFLDRAESAEAEELLPLLRRPEAAALLAELGGSASGAARKGAILAALLELVEPAELGRLLGERWDFWRPLHDEHLRLFRLLFFGNLRQDWTEFVLHDLGVVRYEPYPLRRELRLFDDRRAIDDTLLLGRLRDAVEQAIAADAIELCFEVGEAVRAEAHLRHPVARRKVDRLLLRVGQLRERRGELAEAAALYAAAQEPPARERRARLLAKLGEPHQALEHCREIAAEPRDETEVAFAGMFAARLEKQLGLRAALPKKPRRRTAEVALEKRDGAAVEALALEALAAEGRTGFFAENWLWRSLFGLAFWDVVFAPIAGAFEHPFQLGPLDLHGPDFRRARRAAVEARLDELRAEPEPRARLLEVYRAKQGTANYLVDWGEGSRPAIELALERLHGRQLAAVCDRLSRDLRRYRRGLPDLFVEREEAPGFELLEVKAPGEQLRPEQGAWLDYLEAHGLPAAVLKVRWC